MVSKRKDCKMSKLLCVSVSVMLLVVVMLSGTAYADQTIYVLVANYDKALSQFGVDVKGNTWVETEEDGAINKTAFGAPGDNNAGNDGGEPCLVIKFPEKVKAGESTADGKKWAVWARLYEPQALIDATNFNSFFLRTSADTVTWTPAGRADTTLRWNDPGAAMFPDSINGTDVILTDVGNRLPWWWQKHTANGQSTIDPVIAVGDNYAEIGIRESDAVNYPRIEVICFRNDDKQPADSEVPKLGASAVQSAGKLSITWGKMKSIY